MKKLLLSVIAMLFIMTSCKTKSNCDAYTKNLNNGIDSLENKIQSQIDKNKLLEEYIVFLENDNQLLGSVIAEKELEDSIK
jgi:ABC-type phosphate/phosphonate transport system substrate-binding protein